VGACNDGPQKPLCDEIGRTLSKIPCGSVAATKKAATDGRGATAAAHASHVQAGVLLPLGLAVLAVVAGGVLLSRRREPRAL
jgi:hypothetical protein